MGRWLDFLRSKNPDLVWTSELGEGPGDPLEIGTPTDTSLVASALFIRTADALAQMMRHGGPNLEPSARDYEAVAAGARAAFVKNFVLPDGRLKSDTQTAYALAITEGVLTGESRSRAGQHLARAIEREGNHLTTGMVGTSLLLPALSLVGRDDLAYALLLEERCPSWLCSMKNGATTIWERWDGFTKEKGFFAPESNSFNHYAFGAVGEWMYDSIGGIALDPSAPAGKHVFVRPRPHASLTHARARFDSAYGPIATDWSNEGGSFRLKVTLPPGATATVTLPFPGKATEGRSPIERASGVKVVEAGPTRTVVDIESGAYDFAVEHP
jgi:alpha-L-rhamnosidase